MSQSASLIAQAQAFLRGPACTADAWLLYDYRGLNPFFWQVLGPVPNVTRPCWCLVPRRGRARLLTHHVDAGRFAGTGLPVDSFSSNEQMSAALRRLLRGKKQVAMEYAPNGSLPRVSRVDAGTVELVRSLGVEVVSSADLVQHVTQRWSPAQLASHKRAAEKVSQVVQEAFTHIGINLMAEITEGDAAEFIRRRFREMEMVAGDGPVVAVNAHAGDPHYDPGAAGDTIKRGDWVLIDLWAKESHEDAVYADITWVAYVGSQVPQRHQGVFDLVTGARDAALEFLTDAYGRGDALQGWEVDRVARRFIARGGYGKQFTHRLGHSLGTEVHGDAVNLDSWETRDTRRLLSGLAVTIEPGVYLPDFGVRSEIDVYLSPQGAEVTTSVQREVVLIG